ncbi:hypothetical protein PtA15_5A478 [Puccinia triticina]|uniref:Uncharacterized protein n=1 Tax=Puccinia triticina TaxID=208348 RepID=A0ABY7CM68_9BASI|nr:uncharacterized protein PtA15_5A478 [Puccinia triticina]WAQ84905.1 hypothetical protein PtA15_5A478 [Puccinia triticina]
MVSCLLFIVPTLFHEIKQSLSSGLHEAHRDVLAQEKLALALDPLRARSLHLSTSSSPADHVHRGDEEGDTRRLLASGVLRAWLDSRTETSLVPPLASDPDTRLRTSAAKRAEYARLIDCVLRAAPIMVENLDSLGRLRKLFVRPDTSPRARGGDKGELEWQAARLAEMDRRLGKLHRACALNMDLMACLNSFRPRTPSAVPAE